ncbi:methionyl aminopeptidase [Ceratobasidium sp. AG-I]|nr:methionyl aminopeptidase [Ceratobasidium sp. AG-I]
MLTRTFLRHLRCSRGSSHAQLATQRPNIARPNSTSAANDNSDDSGSIEKFGSYIPVLSDNPLASGTSHILRKSVPAHIKLPPYARSNYRADRPPPYRGNGLVKLGTDDERKVRRAGALAAMALNKAGSLIRPGITSEEIDDEVHDFIISHGAYPSPLGYPSPEGAYPKSTCISVNNCLVHGIPDTRELEDGDILNIDITVYLEEYHGDTSLTFLVGDVDSRGQHLSQLASRALRTAFSVCRPGAHFRDIGTAIRDVVREAEQESGHSYVVSPQFTGHGIGKDFHRPPWIIHIPNEEPGVMQPGHCFTIEPVIIQGTDPSGWMLPDGWTILSESYARSAQAEHTILITETGANMLTDRETAQQTFDKCKPQ